MINKTLNNLFNAKNIQQVDRLLYVVSWLLLGLLVTALFFVSWLYVPPLADAGYYLSYVKCFANKIIPYQNVKLHYPPMFIFYYYIVNLLNINNFGVYVTATLFLICVSGVLVYKIAGFITTYKGIKLYSVFSFLIFCYVFEGIGIELEFLVVFFSLLTVFFYFKYHHEQKIYWLLLAGFCIGCAAWSKQYGLAIAIPIGLDVFFMILRNRKMQFSIILALITGFFASFLVIWGYFMLFYSVSFSHIFNQLVASNNNYGQHSFLQFFKGLYYAVIGQRYALYILFLPFCVSLNTWFVDFKVRVFVFGFLSFSLPFYFMILPHYFLLVLPFALLLGIYVLQQTFNNAWFVNRVLSIFTVIIFLGYPLWTAQKEVRLWMQNTDTHYEKAYMYNIAQQINHVIPTQAPTLNCIDQGYNYLCNFYPPDMQILAYKFTINFEPADFDFALIHAKYIVIQNDFKSHWAKQVTTYNDLVSKFSQNGFTLHTTIDQKYQIWQKYK